jgi:hypothetical protein
MTKAQEHRYEQLAFLYWSGDRDVDIRMHKGSIVKTIKPHQCMGLSHDTRHNIPAGTEAFRETAIVDGEWGASYTCLSCLDAWAIEIDYDGNDKGTA